MALHDESHWEQFNAAQGDRPVRPLCVSAMALRAPGMAIDLGCGAGVETRALLDAGWQVHAIDSVPTLGVHSRLTVQVSRFDSLTALPPADLIYAGYSLPYQTPSSFHRVWGLIRGALRPGGVLAVNLFGDRDGWAGEEGMTFLSSAEARELVAGLEIISWVEEDEEGPAFSGPKHWHVYDILARTPG